MSSPGVLKVGGVSISPSCSSPVSPAILLALSVACVLLNVQMDICCCCLWPAFVQSLSASQCRRASKRTNLPKWFKNVFFALLEFPASSALFKLESSVIRTENQTKPSQSSNSTREEKSRRELIATWGCYFVPCQNLCFSNSCAANRLRPGLSGPSASAVSALPRPLFCVPSDIQMAADTAVKAAPGSSSQASCIFD